MNTRCTGRKKIEKRKETIKRETRKRERGCYLLTRDPESRVEREKRAPGPLALGMAWSSWPGWKRPYKARAHFFFSYSVHTGQILLGLRVMGDAHSLENTLVNPLFDYGSGGDNLLLKNGTENMRPSSSFLLRATENEKKGALFGGMMRQTDKASKRTGVRRSLSHHHCLLMYQPLFIWPKKKEYVITPRPERQRQQSYIVVLAQFLRLTPMSRTP